MHLTTIRFQVRFDDRVHGTFDTREEAYEPALENSPDGVQMHVEAITSEPGLISSGHWIFDRDEARWIEQT